MLIARKFNRIFRNEDVKILKNFKLQNDTKKSKLSNAENHSQKLSQTILMRRLES